jgi:hypothetical protein
MEGIVQQWNRFWYWLQQDANFPTVVLVVITGYYAWVTRKAQDAAKRQAETAQKQFELAHEQFVFAQNQFEFSRQQDEKSRKDFERQLEVAQKQLELAHRQFKVSMIPRVSVNVYPRTENYRNICWSIENNSERDLLIQAAEIRWTFPGKEWIHHLTQYPGGVFEPGRNLSNRETNVVPIPDEYWPTDRDLTMHEAHEYMAIAVTVSDVARILAFRFEFLPGKGQNVAVIEEEV